MTCLVNCATVCLNMAVISPPQKPTEKPCQWLSPTDHGLRAILECCSHKNPTTANTQHARHTYCKP